MPENALAGFWKGRWTPVSKTGHFEGFDTLVFSARDGRTITFVDPQKPDRKVVVQEEHALTSLKRQ